MSRFDNPRNTAPSLEALQNQFLKVPRSTHDYSCTKHFNAWCGVIMPIDHIDTLPNEDYELDYDLIVESISALQKNLKTGFTLYVHAFYMRDSQLWEGAENFYTKGRSGQVQLSKPLLGRSIYDNNSTPNTAVSVDCLLSLMDFLEFPVCNFHSTNYTNAPTLLDLLNLSLTNQAIPLRSGIRNAYLYPNALPYVMYQRIYTEFYMNQNLLINNKGVLPDNVNHMILPYSAGNEVGNTYHTVLYLDYTQPNVSNAYSYDTRPNGDFYVPSASSNKPLALSALRYRQKKGDYFTTALPFQDLVRGTIPSLNLSDLGGSASLDFSGAVKTASATTELTSNLVGTDIDDSVIKLVQGSGVADSTHGARIQYNNVTNATLVSALNRAKVNFTMSLTLANLRALEAYTIFAERMARTNGKYNDMIKAQFGYNPHAKTLDPTYIGGFYQNIDIVSVTQTSPDSSSGTSTGGVGSLSAKAISAGRNNIGHFHSPDYGHIMICASIVPDMVYSNQGAPRNQFKSTQAETYFPLLENLSPQVILNRELYVSGNSSDNQGFGWTELFSEYKSRENKAFGLIGASTFATGFCADSGAYVMKYLFNGVPTLSNEFESLSPQNVPNNIWQDTADVPFILTVGCHVRKTTCMSYITQPGGLSSRLG